MSSVVVRFPTCFARAHRIFPVNFRNESFLNEKSFCVLLGHINRTLLANSLNFLGIEITN